MNKFDENMQLKIIDEGDTPIIDQHFGNSAQERLDAALDTLQMNKRPLHKDGTVTVTIEELTDLADWIRD